MSSLLSIGQLDPRVFAKGIPLAMEFSVNKEIAPYLVSSSKGLVWVPQSRTGRIRAALRRNVADLGVFFMEVVQQVEKMGLEAGWGNVHPLTEEGVREAVAHLESYDLTPVQALVNPSFEWGKWEDGFPVLPGVAPENVEMVEWVHPAYVVIVPKDRDFVGFVARAGHTSFVSVIHNPSRSIGIARSAA